jgi:hypothetical protein
MKKKKTSFQLSRQRERAIDKAIGERERERNMYLSRYFV